MHIEPREAAVRSLPVPAKQQVHWLHGKIEGREVPHGLGLAITPHDVRSFILNYRNAAGRERRITIGRFPDWSVATAVRRARELRQEIDKGNDPLGEKRATREQAAAAAAAKTVAQVADDFMTARGPKMRRPENFERHFRLHIKPAIGAKAINELRRRDVADMVRHVKETSGPSIADHILTSLTSMLHWYEGQDDEFSAPTFRGLREPQPSRDRVLSDAELRLVWRAAGELQTTYGRLIRFYLLTGCRRDDARLATWSEIDLERAEWTIPAARYKTGREHVVPLSGAAIALLGPAAGDPAALLFPGQRGKPTGNGGFLKDALDLRITALNDGAPIPNWTVHDLRRTVRTLLARAGVDRSIAERVIGHGIAKGVEAIYDRFDYAPQKRRAVEALAREIASITGDGAPAKVVPLRVQRAS